MELKTGNKKSKERDIPNEWMRLKVSELGKIVTGGTPRTETKIFWNGNYPWITPTDISDKRDIRTSERYLSRRGLEAIRCLPADTVLVTCIASIGKNAILRVIGSCNQQINALIPTKKHDVEFLFYLFEANRQYLMAHAGMTATWILPKKAFQDLYFSIPPLTEQRAIATSLGDVDALISSLTRLIAKKRNLKQAVMQQLLTGQIRLPGFSGDWEVRQLGELGATYGGLTGKTKSNFGAGPAKYITFMNIMNNVAIDHEMFEPVEVKSYEKQNQVLKGDVFFNGSSETPEEVGMCSALLTDVNNVYLNSFSIGFRFREKNEYQSIFIAYFFRSNLGRELIRSLAQGATRYNLSKASLMKLKLLLPSPNEQKAIAVVLSGMDTEIEALEARLAKIRNLKQGMMQELLTGRIRLV